MAPKQVTENWKLAPAPGYETEEYWASVAYFGRMIEEHCKRAHINKQDGIRPAGQRRVRKGRSNLVEHTMVPSPADNCAISDAKMGTGDNDSSTRPVVQALLDVRSDKLMFPEYFLFRANFGDDR